MSQGPARENKSARFRGETADMSKDCAFCGVVSRESAAELVLEDTAIVGFLDARPLRLGHVLVVPRAHHVTLPDLPAELVEPLFATVQRMTRALVAGLGVEGTFVGINNVVSQSVPHLHVHVVPRRKGDGLRGFFWPREKYASADEARDYARRIREALA